MAETDDRLAGEPVWELFAHPAAGPAKETTRARVYRRLGTFGLIGACVFLFPRLAVVLAGLAVVVPEFLKSRQLARSIPDRDSATISARFTWAWGAWKLGTAGVVMMFLIVMPLVPRRDGAGGEHALPSPAFEVAMILCGAGYVLSAALTAMGLYTAYRSGMRIWIGEGVNRARTLLMAMLLVGLTLGVLVPAGFWLPGEFPRADRAQGPALSFVLTFLGFLGAPFVILLAVDWFSRRVVADRPGKFGPKVPTVGKWNSSSKP